MSATLRLAWVATCRMDRSACSRAASANALIFISHINRRFAAGHMCSPVFNKGGGRMQCDQKPMM